MSDLLSIDERRENVALMVHSFKLNPKKNIDAGLMQIQGTHVREILFQLCVLYLTHDDESVPHKEAVAYACENVYDHIAGIGTYVSPIDTSFWRPPSPGEIDFIKMWFSRGIGWAEKRRSAPRVQKVTSRPHVTKERELVAV